MNDDDADRIMQFFTYAHLPPHLQARSKPFADLAAKIFDLSPEVADGFAALSELIRETTPPNPETTVALDKINQSRCAAGKGLALRRLLEGKDAAVRALIAKPVTAKPDLGPLCQHGLYASRCTSCGAAPINASAG